VSRVAQHSRGRHGRATRAHYRDVGHDDARVGFADAVRIRRWDDEAKIVGAVCPPLAAYRPLIERWLGPQPWPAAAGIA